MMLRACAIAAEVAHRLPHSVDVLNRIDAAGVDGGIGQSNAVERDAPWWPSVAGAG
jgi:hypothetical protein